MKVPPLKTTVFDPSHIEDCEENIEPFIRQVAEQAEAAGWRPEIVAMAVVRVGTARLEALAATDAVSPPLQLDTKH